MKWDLLDEKSSYLSENFEYAFSDKYSVAPPASYIMKVLGCKRRKAQDIRLAYFVLKGLLKLLLGNMKPLQCAHNMQNETVSLSLEGKYE